MADGGDRAEFERTVLPHLDAAYNAARWILRDDADAGDAVQESAMRAWRYFDTFRGRAALPWLLRIVRNTAYTILEKRRRDEAVEPLPDHADVEDPSSADPAHAMDRGIDAAALRAAVEALPAEFREAIVLRELQGMSYKEIAEATDVSIGTVMSRLARGRRRLQAALSRPTPPARSEVEHGM